MKSRGKILLVFALSLLAVSCKYDSKKTLAVGADAIVAHIRDKKGHDLKVVDREFAEESYRAALTALDLARTNSVRQSRYLAVFIQPTLPERADFPRRRVILGLAGMFLLLSWAIMALVYYSIRDRQ